MNVSLRNWLANGWLKKHQTSRREIQNLLSLVHRDLRDSRTPGLSADARLSLAYEAALQAASAALAAAGFQTATESHHYRTIHSLAHTIEANSGFVNELDRFRTKRNTAKYELAGATSEAEARRITSLAERLCEDVTAWLRDTHPQLLQK